MSNTDMKKDNRDTYGMTPDDWKRQRAMTDDEITAAAHSDPDAQPVTPEQVAAAMSHPRVLSKVIRNKLSMTRQRFAEAYGVPADVQEAWERRTLEPTETEMAYLRLIERAPELAKLESVA